MLVSRKVLIAALFPLVLAAAAFGQTTYNPALSPPVQEIKLHPRLPDLDIRADGEDANVLIQEGFNVRIDFTLAARGFAGENVDVWVMLETAGGIYTFDGKGPLQGWSPGLNNFYYSGPLTDMKDVVLDYALPLGFYNAYLGIDRKADGILDPGAFIFMDMVDFEVFVMPGFFEDFEDGVADGWAPDGAHWSVGKGVYLLDCPAAGNYFSYYYPMEFGDSTYSADMRMVDTGYTTDSVERGLVFRSDGTPNNGYQLVMDNNGNIRLRICVNGPIPMILKSAVSQNAVPGVGNWNTLEVDARDSGFSVYVNGVFEFYVDDFTFAGGWAGLIGEGSSQHNIDYEFDNVGLMQ